MWQLRQSYTYISIHFTSALQAPLVASMFLGSIQGGGNDISKPTLHGAGLTKGLSLPIISIILLEPAGQGGVLIYKRVSSPWTKEVSTFCYGVHSGTSFPWN
uniref:Uncharacterized protein n=1 Tax=Micrurus paraensis TaxID=1970185 RepID=A0A2D4L683_9SAUR